ncbi:MAG: ribonuclease H-like domain-containing protein, partial [Syntrophales bacterium]
LGFSGGLKGCERQMGIDRGDLKDIDGYEAVLLWYDYKRTGNKKSLETLIQYNSADARNLETLMVMAYNLKLKGTPFYERSRI